VFLYRIRAKDI